MAFLINSTEVVESALVLDVNILADLDFFILLTTHGPGNCALVLVSLVTLNFCVSTLRACHFVVQVRRQAWPFVQSKCLSEPSKERAKDNEARERERERERK